MLGLTVFPYFCFILGSIVARLIRGVQWVGPPILAYGPGLPKRAGCARPKEMAHRAIVLVRRAIVLAHHANWPIQILLFTFYFFLLLHVKCL